MPSRTLESLTSSSRSFFVCAAVICASSTVFAQAWQDPEPICSSADVIFCSGFEGNDRPNWDDYDGNPEPWNIWMSDPGPLGNPSNTVMRMRVPSGRGGTDLVKVLPSQHDKLYARWYQKWEPGYDFSAQNHGGGFHGGDRNNLGRSNVRPSGADWFSSWLEPQPNQGRMKLYTYYRGMYMDCADPQGQCYGDHFPCFLDATGPYCDNPDHRPTIMPPEMETGRWYCLETMLDAGPAAASQAQAGGVLDFWIDGVQYGPWTDLWMRTTTDLKITILWLNLFHHGSHSTEGVMIDNVVVSKSRVGCMTASSAPPTPENHRRGKVRPQ